MMVSDSATSIHSVMSELGFQIFHLYAASKLMPQIPFWGQEPEKRHPAVLISGASNNEKTLLAPNKTKTKHSFCLVGCFLVF